MKSNKCDYRFRAPNQIKIIKSNFVLPVSKYSQIYRNYLIREFPQVEMMIKKIVRMPCCQQFYLKYPLESLMRGTVKKLMLNMF